MLVLVRVIEDNSIVRGRGRERLGQNFQELLLNDRLWRGNRRGLRGLAEDSGAPCQNVKTAARAQFPVKLCRASADKLCRRLPFGRPVNAVGAALAMERE